MIRTRKPVDTRRVVPQVSWMLGLPCLCLVFLGSFAGGCATGSSGEKQQYILEAVRPGEAVQPVVEGSLEVHRFSVDAAFATRNLVYRLGRFEYETDYYRQFLIAPGTMITEQTRDWLADSGLFTRVLPMGSRLAPGYTLEGNVTSLYGDFSKGSTSAAIIEIRFFLLDNANGTEEVAFARTYRIATPVQDRTAEIFVDALNRSLADILTRLEADLKEAFSGKGRGPSGDSGAQ
jgi:cholesterol transport system auxiliary component